MKKRAIFAIRDQDGVIDQSDLFLMNAISATGFEIVLMLCGPFDKKRIAPHVIASVEQFEIQDIAFSDFKIMKSVLNEGIREKVDELLFVDNSIFGPFYELNAIIQCMQEKEYDFWGMTKIGKRLNSSWQEEKEYLQMYFLMLNRKMLLSEELWNFFSETDNEVIFEKEFTDYFQKLGFRWDAYIDLEQYYSQKLTNNFDFLRDANFDLIKNHNFPFLKKECFSAKSYAYGSGNDLKKTLNILETKNLYRMDVLWKTVLRKNYVDDIRNALNLNFILPTENTEQYQLENVYKKTAVIMHMAYWELIPYVERYIREIPAGIHKTFVVIDEKTQDGIKSLCAGLEIINYEIRKMIPNRGRDMNALFVVCRDILEKYEVVCFTHDKRTSGDNGAWTIGSSFMEQLWDNTLKSEGYINRILKLFCEEERLGYLTVPGPYYGNYTKVLGKEWTSCFQTTCELAKKMNLHARMSQKHQPIGLGNAFWCKTAILKKMLEYGLKTSDFPGEPMAEDGTISHALERIFPYAAQDAGYYSGTVENTEFAETRMTALSYMTNHLISKLTDNPMLAGRNTFEAICDSIENKEFENFINDSKSIYVFGTGATGKRAAKLLQKRQIPMEGFICSDGYPKEDYMEGIKTYYLSEIRTNTEKTGIILAVNKKFYSEIRDKINALKCNIYYL